MRVRLIFAFAKKSRSQLIQKYFLTAKAQPLNHLPAIHPSRFRPIPLDPTLHSSPEVNRHDSYDR